MKKQVSKTILLITSAFILFSGCHNDIKLIEPDDPSRIFIAYSLKYYEGLDSLLIFPEMLLDNASGRRAYPPEPIEITFNGELLSPFHYVRVKAPADTALLVYKDITGAAYRAVVNPIILRQIPDTFTSVTRNVESYFYWQGDSTELDETAEITLGNVDSLTAYSNTTGPFNDFIVLYTGLLNLLSPGTDNTLVNFRVSRSIDLPLSAPKGAIIKQEIHAKDKIISVY